MVKLPSAIAYGLNFGLPLHVLCLSVVAGLDGVSHKELEAINLDIVFTSLGVFHYLLLISFGWKVGS